MTKETEQEIIERCIERVQAGNSSLSSSTRHKVIEMKAKRNYRPTPKRV